MWGGWYNTPNMFAFMKKSRALYTEAMQTPMRSVSELAVVLDEEASYGMGKPYYGKTYYQQLMWLGDAGAPYDLYLKGEFSAEDLKDYKCVLYLAPFEISDKDKEVISCLSENGITVVCTGKPYTLVGKNVQVSKEVLLESALRTLYAKAGVHTYLDKTGLLYANGRFVCVTASEDGEYTLTMPNDCTLTDVFGGERYITVNKKVCIVIQKNQSILFEVTYDL